MTKRGIDSVDNIVMFKRPLRSLSTKNHLNKQCGSLFDIPIKAQLIQNYMRKYIDIIICDILISYSSPV